MTKQQLEQENQFLKDRLKEVAPVLKRHLGNINYWCGCTEIPHYFDDIYQGRYKTACVEHGGTVRNWGE